MGCEYGRLLTCDRCGKAHFCPRTGFGSNRGALWETFVPWPRGWYCPDILHFYCPECAKGVDRT